MPSGSSLGRESRAGMVSMSFNEKSAGCSNWPSRFSVTGSTTGEAGSGVEHGDPSRRFNGFLFIGEGEAIRLEPLGIDTPGPPDASPTAYVARRRRSSKLDLRGAPCGGDGELDVLGESTEDPGR